MGNDRKTVLLVDDEADVRQTVGVLLGRAGYEVLTAEDGQQALEDLREMGPVDLIVLDVMMPRLNGFQTLSLLRTGRFRDIPVVLLTARSDVQDIARGYEQGADLYVAKPFKPAVLLKAVEYLAADPGPERAAELERALMAAEEVCICARK